jgi:hypothetical protein
MIRKLGERNQGEPRVSLTQRLTRAHAAQGGVTLGPEQGELGANFCYLGPHILDFALQVMVPRFILAWHKGVRR